MPTLTGLGERVHLLDERVGLDLHVDDIANVLRYEDLYDVILVGHSYGGPVVTGAADRVPERVAKLVHLDSVYPRNGQSVADVLPLVNRLRDRGDTVDGVELILLPRPDGGPFYGVDDPDDRAWMAGRLTAFPWRCFADPLRLQDPARVAAIPSFHVLCPASLADRDPEVLAAAEARGALWVVDTSHDLMISEPRTVVDLRAEIAAR